MLSNNASKERLDQFLQEQIEDIKSSFAGNTKKQKDKESASKTKDVKSNGYEEDTDMDDLGTVEGDKPGLPD